MSSAEDLRSASLDVLVVDDNARNLLAMEAILEEVGAGIYSARSGEEALKLLRERDFAVVLLDVQMPTMDGFEAARIIRTQKRSAHVPIIFVTAYHQDLESVSLGYSLGAVDFLFKPIVPQVLRSKVSVFVELAHRANRLRAHEERARAQALLEARQLWEAEALRQQMQQERAAAETLQTKAEELAGTVHALEEARQELVRMNHQLEEADRRKNEALAMVSHELRNPLAAIATSVSIIHDYPHREEERKRAYRVAERQIQHLSRLAGDLLDVARITSGQMELRWEPVDVDEIVPQALQQVHPQMEERGHKLVLSIAGGLRILGDPIRLTQVLTNLLSNAARYTDGPGHIELAAEQAGDSVQLRVRDNGRGLSPETIGRIFEPFAKHDRHSPGLGLGLALVQRLVELHGGSVSVRSQGEGFGSEFVMCLPLLRVSENAER
jgi:signal transduction histidine kinase